jgi:hypothetical protein
MRSVDVGAGTLLEACGGHLVDALGQPVCVSRAGREILFQRQPLGVRHPVGKTHAVNRLGRGDDDLSHAHLGGRLKDVECAHDVYPPGFGIRGDDLVVQHRRGEMHHRVKDAAPAARVDLVEPGIAVEHGIDLPEIGDIPPRVGYARMVQWCRVQVQDPVPLLVQIGHDMAAGLARPSVNRIRMALSQMG